MKASIQRRRNIPRLLPGSKINWSSSITPDSGPPRIPKQHHTKIYNVLKKEANKKKKETKNEEDMNKKQRKDAVMMTINPPRTSVKKLNKSSGDDRADSLLVR